MCETGYKEMIDSEKPPVYDLCGVAYHYGSSLQSGHYSATCLDNESGTWFDYNDSFVSRVSEPL